MVSGDDRLAEDMHERLPGVPTVVVKQGLDHRAARNRPRGDVLKSLRTGSQEAVKSLKSAPIFRRGGPVSF